MNPAPPSRPPPVPIVARWGTLLLVCLISSLPAAAQTESGTTILAIEGRVEIALSTDAAWRAAATNQTLRAGDQIRTGFRGRATIRLTDQTVLKLKQLTTIQVQPPETDGTAALLDLKKGASYFIGRDRPSKIEFRTPQASGAILGTEFVLAITDDNLTEVSMIEGSVRLGNAAGEATLTTGEQGRVEAGQAPIKTALINAENIIQWALYYPAVIDLQELNLPLNSSIPSASLAAYRAGNLPAALRAIPNDWQPAGERETIYLAAVVLASGQVEESLAWLDGLDNLEAGPTALVRALRVLIGAVKNQANIGALNESNFAGEWLAESYRAQATHDLERARNAAVRAVGISPGFGFARSRLAELEFGFGRTRAARAALERALELTPQNAQALTVRGFIAAAENDSRLATRFFDRARELDPALANAWLGRGLISFRTGHPVAGATRLLVAAGLEPNRSLLRSYLGKAWSMTGQDGLAETELDLAKRLDPADPTPWLYSALLNQELNRVNAGIRDLERSRELNDNRGLFRSRSLLDQDQAVRSANLASLYRDAGAVELGVREAGRAVHLDYGNASAHFFLAGGYDQLRDPNQVNLRYETPWLSELLLANLLSPVGSGALSQNISQQEYSKLFADDGLGGSSTTEYLSNGDWNQWFSQFGTFGNFSYALDAEYRDANGWQPNGDREQLTLTGKVKQQVTAQDTALLQFIYHDAETGDVAQYHDPASANQTLRTTENQEPNLFAGWNHEWSAQHRTLFLLGRLHADTTLRDEQYRLVSLVYSPAGDLIGAILPGAGGEPLFDLNLQSGFEVFSGEVQHIVSLEDHTLIAGARVQLGKVESALAQTRIPGGSTSPLFYPPVNQSVRDDLRRFNVYLEERWRVNDRLSLLAGLGYDHLEHPVNQDIPPLAGGTETVDQVSPRAGLLLGISEELSFRAAVTRSLGGQFFDNSLRLEPTDLLGFTHAFRSLTPESVAGPIAGAQFTTWHAAFDATLATDTYLTLAAERLESDGTRALGVMSRASNEFDHAPDSTRQRLEFRETTVSLTGNQLLGDQFSLGAGYRVSKAELEETFVEVPATAQNVGAFARSRSPSSYLHHAQFLVRWHDPRGWFAEFATHWRRQSNRGYTPALPGDDFWQFDLLGGYRFWRRRGEIKLGVLNLGDQDYRLSPLNYHRSPPRERTFFAGLKLNF